MLIVGRFVINNFRRFSISASSSISQNCITTNTSKKLTSNTFKLKFSEIRKILFICFL